MDGFVVNNGKSSVVSAGGSNWYCYCVRTKVITAEDDLAMVMAHYVGQLVQPGDVVFVSEKMVACAQGRAIPIDEIRPGRLATLLSRFVKKTKHGIGLGMPETMQCAIWECGRLRILLASAIGAFGKLLRKSGWFYHIAGRKAASIDGPCHYTIPPYNSHVVLGPSRPDNVARELADRLGVAVMIVDLNDLGGVVLGRSDGVPDNDSLLTMLRQNPLGQASESTPIGILRPMCV